MKTLLTVTLVTLTLVTLTAAESPSYYDNYCKEHPFAKRCVSPTLGGSNSIKQERRREVRDEYRHTNDVRQYPGQDLDDLRTSL